MFFTGNLFLFNKSSSQIAQFISQRNVGGTNRTILADPLSVLVPPLVCLSLCGLGVFDQIVHVHHQIS